MIVNNGAMIYDSDRERVVIFGGQDDVSGELNDTWWQLSSAASFPHEGMDHVQRPRPGSEYLGTVHDRLPIRDAGRDGVQPR